MPTNELPSDEELTFDDLHRETGLSKKTIREYCSPRRHISRRLRAIRYTRKTVRIRRSDWMKFKEAMSK